MKAKQTLLLKHMGYYIHREGYSILSSLLIGFLFLNAALYYFLPQDQVLLTTSMILSATVFLLFLQFFRIPTTDFIANENQIIAPADGKVVVIEEVVENEYFNGPRRQISIFMSPFNVHVNRNPIAGIVTYFKYHPGKYLVAWHPKSSTENERTTLVVKHANGSEILFRQIAGALAKRICWYVKEQDVVKQNEEFGFIKFGSRVDVFVPLDAKVLVKLGEKSTGGKTVLAEFNS
jgi:phosphatidylserine decarboxylase